MKIQRMTEIQSETILKEKNKQSRFFFGRFSVSTQNSVHLFRHEVGDFLEVKLDLIVIK